MNSHEHLLNSCSVAIVSLDNQLTIKWLNFAAESILGCSKRFAQGKHIANAVPLPVTLLNQIHEAIETTQSVVSRKVEILPRLHGTMVIDCVVTPVSLADNSTQVVLEILDVDRSLKIATERALFDQQERSQNMLRGVAHEVLNPLGGIRGAAQLLEQELGHSKLTEYTSLLIKETDRLQQLLQKMLGPNSRPTLANHNIHEILNYVGKLLLTDNPGKVATQYDYDPSIPDLYCDREKLVQVFINLVSNALYALKDTSNPKVIFVTRVERNFTIRGELKRLVCKVHIQDNGPGIPPDLSETLFYPLVSGSSKGTGLGLSIAQSLVVQHGGLIECRQRNGHTSFEVTIPIESSHESQ